MLDPNALAAADTVAKALSDPDAVRAAAPPSDRAWPQSLAGGAAGIALLHIERARSGRGDSDTVHAWLSAAASDDLTAAPNAGLYLGAPAMAFATHTAAGSTRRYQRTLALLDAATLTLTRARLAAAYARIDRGDRPVMKEFDAIRGLTGLGAYHLRAHPDHPITAEVLAYLVKLTEPLPGHNDGLPGWWTNVAPNGEPSPQFPGGHGNFGLAHGIGASLALLSLAVLGEQKAPGAHDAIARICAWTDQWQQGDNDSPWWPGFITPSQVRAHSVDATLRPRPSWCYGVAGTARAQQLAARALGDSSRQQTAERGLLSVLRDPAQLQLLDGIGLCHGTAGLLHAAGRMAADATIPGIPAELHQLAARLTTQLAQGITDPELLDGAAGAALALHTFGTGAAPASGWDAFLLIA
ncbi:Lanthionine synthetase C-like protein [Actinacidiphila yanglinensis]|uniref:Lanthionine synthetase C-like protein n=1 Tax=Actinacidiphila yanglinensis TaxID=310779 RepID=A0A1H6EBU8_9ACTN|nr:lanthionine synthetase C family protein [Actinacidiphila yanglinensis]SEG94751.1 Lanthionine synthetase C-like protein [Actinacidiphila yanglinensis]